MIKGPADIILTHETIVAAVQMYFDSTFADGKAPTVKVVKSDYVNFRVTVQGETISPENP